MVSSENRKVVLLLLSLCSIGTTATAQVTQPTEAENIETLDCALKLMDEELSATGLGFPSSGKSSPTLKVTFTKLTKKADGNGDETEGYGYYNGKDDQGKHVIYISTEASTSYAPPKDGVALVAPEAAGFHDLKGPFSTASELMEAFQNSNVPCAVMASVLFHEGLHGKLSDAGVVNGSDSCGHLAIEYTSAKKDCENAEELEACASAKASLPPEDPAVQDENCPVGVEPGETNAEYIDRLNELRVGFCGMYKGSAGKLKEDLEKAKCCFCDTMQQGCGALAPWTNPCPPTIDPDTGEETPPLLKEPDFGPDCEGPTGPDGEETVLLECPAC